MSQNSPSLRSSRTLSKPLQIPARIWPMTVFPILQTGLFALSCYFATWNLTCTAVCILASSLALNFTIHISVHELLHYSDRRPLPVWMNMVISAVSGLSFDAYRFHHHNHHRHNNGLGDYSKTWRMTPRGPTAYGVLRYALSWPLQVVQTTRELRAEKCLNRPRLAHRRMRYENCAILAVIIGLGMCSWYFAVLYMVMVYFGWSLVSVHNYGQHPPDEFANAVSFTSSNLYNRLFFNNGLHHEHHAEPAKASHELSPNLKAPQVPGPHLVSPFRRKLHREATSVTSTK